MRTTFTIILLLGLLYPNIKASEKEVESRITDVVVFLNGAQITRTAEALIPAGETQIIFKGLTSQLKPNSLQVSSNQAASIRSVNHSRDYMTPPKVNEQTNRLIKQRNELQDSIDRAKNKKKVRLQEQEMLLKNQSVGGNETGLKVEELKSAMDFFRDRMTEIEQELFELKKQITPMKKRLKNLNKQLEELRAYKDRPTTTVRVRIASEQRKQTTFQIQYAVNQASWQPFYDLRVEDISHPITLQYMAKISQNTGTDWNGVNLSLSTGDPSVNHEKPELSPWVIRPVEPLKRESLEKNEPKKMRSEAAIQLSATEPGKIAPRISPEHQQTTTIFHINHPFSVQSGEKQHDVTIMDHEIETKYQYATVPKRSQYAYLMAEITDWKNLDLLPGKAGIYFNQTFQGNTHIDPYKTDDTLSLSIGRDPEIVVNREMLKDYSSNTFFGNNQKKTKAWKIKVRNSKNTAVEIVVEDQIPVSGDSDIKVELKEISGARVDHRTGMLKWPLTLEPGESKAFNFVYSVQYPKDAQVILE